MSYVRWFFLFIVSITPPHFCASNKHEVLKCFLFLLCASISSACGTSLSADRNTNIGADRKLIDSLPALEIVSSFSVGLDKVDLGYCKEKSIRVTNTPDVLTEDVADLAIRLILATFRRVCECDRYVRAGLWKKGDFKLTTKFSGKKVGSIGLGRIGTAIAKRAEAFNCPGFSIQKREKSLNTTPSEFEWICFNAEYKRSQCPHKPHRLYTTATQSEVSIPHLLVDPQLKLTGYSTKLDHSAILNLQCGAALVHLLGLLLLLI
ncbi:hypothetical protein L1887_29988 [Cichorium endivia]|nr:hypothetical protein L1887_29988 [Cichorium endivia]